MKTTTVNNKITPLYQLRIYELFDSNREQFLVRFRDHASRIMRKHGFNILHMWETRAADRPEFVYLLKWENEEMQHTAWDGFMADEEWKDIKARTTALHGNMVGRIEDRALMEER